jgi:hypothetical protein
LLFSDMADAGTRRRRRGRRDGVARFVLRYGLPVARRALTIVVCAVVSAVALEQSPAAALLTAKG